MRRWMTRFGAGLLMLAACTGEIGDALESGVGSRGGSTSGSGDAGSTSEGGVDPGPPPPIPYAPVSSYVYVRKVKSLLTGLAPTDDEQAAVASDPGALKGLVDQWMATADAQAKLLTFLGNAFQQSNAPDNVLMLQFPWAYHNSAETRGELLGNVLEELSSNRAGDGSERRSRSNHGR